MRVNRLVGAGVLGLHGGGDVGVRDAGPRPSRPHTFMDSESQLENARALLRECGFRSGAEVRQAIERIQWRGLRKLEQTWARSR